LDVSVILTAYYLTNDCTPNLSENERKSRERERDSGDDKVQLK